MKHAHSKNPVSLACLAMARSRRACPILSALRSGILEEGVGTQLFECRVEYAGSHLSAILPRCSSMEQGSSQRVALKTHRIPGSPPPKHGFPCGDRHTMPAPLSGTAGRVRDDPAKMIQPERCGSMGAGCYPAAFAGSRCQTGLLLPTLTCR